MKLLFNIDVIEGNRVKANPSDYLKSLPPEQQVEEVTRFLQWAQSEAGSATDPKLRAEAEIGIAVASEFLEAATPPTGRIYTGDDPGNR